MKFLKQFTFLFFLTCFAPFICLAETTQVTKISFDEKNNLEIFLNQKTEFRAYKLSNPQRLVVDITNTQVSGMNVLQEVNLPDFVSKVRRNNGENLRIVFDLRDDLQGDVKIQSAQFVKLKNDSSPKIVVKVSAPNSKNLQIISNAEKSESANAANQEMSVDEVRYIMKNNDKQNVKNTSGKNAQIAANVVEKSKTKKLPIIVIDAGHGGKDPGTIGDYARTKEKNITLSYAKELAKHLTNTKNYKVYLTRGDDRFLPLKQRVEKARRLNADLFISLHANSMPDGHASGLSVYTLSEKSSDKQAQLLAQKENRADIIYGMNFSDTSGDILKTLIDLSQRDSMNSSARFANIAIKSVQKNGVEILHNTHRFAGFVVLTAPDVSSVLIELGYLSNRREEEKLNSLTYKRDLTKGLVDAINEYFKVK